MYMLAGSLYCIAGLVAAVMQNVLSCVVWCYDPLVFSLVLHSARAVFERSKLTHFILENS